MIEPAVLFEVPGRVAKMAIDRPQAMNAINMEAGAGRSEALTRFSAAPELWTAVITGAGDKAFRQAPTSRPWPPVN